MPPVIANQLEATRRDRILTVVLVYTLFSGLWILLSDKLMQMVFSDPGQIILVGMFKGWLFVGVTALLLYGLMRRWLGTDPETTAMPMVSRRLYKPFVGLSVVIITLTSVGIINAFNHHQEAGAIRLQAIADLKARQIADWLTERQGDADFVQTSDFFADHYRRWQESGDVLSGDRLQKRLEQLRKSRGFCAISLLNTQGEKIWGSASSPANLSPPLQEAAQLASSSRKVGFVGPYRDLTGHVRLDFVAPLTAMPSPAIVILHIDLAEWLLPTLQTWPIPSISGETVLFRRDGDQVLFLNELKYKKGSAANLHLPITTDKLIFAQVLRGEAPLGKLIQDMDYRGVPSSGVARSIPGTSWYLMVKQDQSELYAEVLNDGIWVGFVGLLFLFMAGSGLYLLRQREALVIANSVQQSQAERLRALNLLAAIAESSDDAIFAKDLDGRYILFNAAASHFVGKPAEAVLGQDDRAIFPAEQAAWLMGINRQVITENQSYTHEETLSTANGPRTFLATKGPLRDEQGNIIGIFGISRDITGRKQAEMALHSSEKSYRSLFDNMMNGYAHCLMIYEHGEAKDFRYLKINKAFEALTGLKDVVGRHVSEVIPGFIETNRDLLEIFGEVAKGGPARQFESYVPTLGIWFSISVFSPQAEQIVVVFDNISERKQAEMTLRESEEFKHAILDSVNAHIAVLDNQGTITAVNRAWECFGKDNAAYPGGFIGVGAKYLDICRHSIGPYSGAGQAAHDGIQAVLDKRLPSFNLEYPCHLPTRQRWFILTVTPMGEGKQGAVITHTNITERKEAEEALSQLTDDMSATLQAVPDLLFEVDETGRYVKVKTTQEEQLAAPPAQLLGHTVHEVLPPEAARTVMESLAAASQMGSDYGRTINLQLAGKGRYFELSVARKSGVKGNLQHFIVLSRDITERKATELALRQQTGELAERNAELQRFNRAMVGRELNMIELKQQVNALCQQLGQEPPYPLAFLDAATATTVKP